jgi:Holliday junction resolvase RusA-like endonuclease
MSSKKAIDRIALMSQMRSVGLVARLEEPLFVQMKFHLGGAATRSTARLNGKPKPTTPDIDNLVKYYLDVMNDLIFKDDRYVTHLTCLKIYSEKKKVEIVITPMSQVLEKKKKDV